MPRVAGFVYDRTPAVEDVSRYPFPAGAAVGSVHPISAPKFDPSMVKM
jgi:hypothetical protein